MIRVESYVRTLEQADAQGQFNSESIVDPQSTMINLITLTHIENVKMCLTSSIPLFLLRLGQLAGHTV